MKHKYKDYIEWIDNRLEILKEPLTALEVIAFSGITNVIRASLLANKATLERHKENPDNVLTQLYGDKEFYTEKYNACQTCRTVAFPCPSLLDVTNQLDEVM